jgi:FtsP/CotA-like multicopper oxidase with cupredoxin domain
MSSRRWFLRSAITAVAGLGGASRLLGENRLQKAGSHSVPNNSPDRMAGGPLLPVITPDVKDLPFTIDNGAKVFQLVAEPVKRKISPWKTIECWGFNGSCPGPTIQVNQGDRVRVVLENRLPESLAIHWHGLEIPYAMDGMPYLSQKPIAPGARFVHEFRVHQNGTFFYHSHSPMQQMMGMVGMFILHPPRPHIPAVDYDFGIVLQEWAVLPNNTVPNTANMEWNWLTFNGVSSPMTTPIIVRLGGRVRIRFVNLGMDHHPIHLHGHTFVVTGTEAGRQPETTWGPANTALVGVAQARDIEFVANNPGEWMLHCHMPHHNMNAMSDLLGDRMMMTADTEDERTLSQMQTLADEVGFEHVHHAPIARDANKVPGFPQDAFMDMGMDEAVAKPENNGLPRNWSAMMMGMMTLVRVLPPDLYDLVMDDVRRGYVAPVPPVGGHSHGEHERHQEQHPGHHDEGQEGGSR